MLPTNAQGIPQVLLSSDSAFNGQFSSGNDIVLPDQRVTLRYVIDRLCDGPGLDTVLGSGHCNTASAGPPPGGSGSLLQRAELASSGGAAAVSEQVV